MCMDDVDDKDGGLGTGDEGCDVFGCHDRIRVDDGRAVCAVSLKGKSGRRRIADMCVRNPIAQPVARLYSPSRNGGHCSIESRAEATRERIQKADAALALIIAEHARSEHSRSRTARDQLPSAITEYPAAAPFVAATLNLREYYREGNPLSMPAINALRQVKSRQAKNISITDLHIHPKIQSSLFNKIIKLIPTQTDLPC